MDCEIRTFRPDDYDAVRSLWEVAEGVGLSTADSREGVTSFLARNPDLSLVAVAGTDVIAALLVGHDGRRGYLHHLSVSPAVRRNGLGRTLVREGLNRLARVGIQKCHLFIFGDNAEGEQFWRAIGAQERIDLKVYSLPT